MKLGWICYSYTGDPKPDFRTQKPEPWCYEKIVQVVYAEIEEN
jgi:hypothetical protein